ncbi:response regulator [Streptomyces sp. CA-250714]|uniref:response regulator n=1 Tax=Streptomyces sp. CA-250714 TaxID=3240060 RepID=UPI003D8FE056
MTISVVIADEQEMVRPGFRMVLEGQSDVEVLDDVVDGAAALDAVERLRPDVLLLDIRMPKLDGLEVTRRLAERAAAHPVYDHKPHIVMVTTFDLDEYVHAALLSGADGFLLKDASPTLLVEGVRSAAVGDSLVSPTMTVRLLRERAPKSAGSVREPSEPLTEDEQKVVRALAAGSPDAEIAHKLSISTAALRTHLASIKAKLKTRNRVEIAAWAWESGLATDG